MIVESPTKTKSLSKYLGKGFEVLASMGHVSDLPKSKMGVEIEEKGGKYSFKPEYVLVRGKGKEVSKLKAAAKRQMRFFWQLTRIEKERRLHGMCRRY